MFVRSASVCVRADEGLVVRERDVVVLELERVEDLLHDDVVLGIERDEHAAAAVDEPVDRRGLVGEERPLRTHDEQDRDVLRDVLAEAVRGAEGAQVVRLIEHELAQLREPGALVGGVRGRLPGALAVARREGGRLRLARDES